MFCCSRSCVPLGTGDDHDNLLLNGVVAAMYLPLAWSSATSGHAGTVEDWSAG